MRIKKNLFLGVNIIIIAVYILVLIPCIAVLFSYNRPSDLKTATGTLAKFKHVDKSNPNVFDYLFNSTASYFNVTFTDGSFFEAVGIRYNNINDELFSEIAVGNEITITYEHRVAAPDVIYGIEYNGTVYLKTDDVFADLDKEAKTAHTVSPIVIGVVTVAAGVCFFLNYKKNRKASKE